MPLTYNVGALAKAAGVNVETIRYYERRGLMPAPSRSESGYRQYTDEDRRRLDLIRRAKTLGFTLTEIAALLHDGHGAADIHAAAQRKLRQVETEMRRIATLRHRLASLAAICAEGPEEDCTAFELGA